MDTLYEVELNRILYKVKCNLNSRNMSVQSKKMVYDQALIQSNTQNPDLKTNMQRTL